MEDDLGRELGMEEDAEEEELGKVEVSFVCGLDRALARRLLRAARRPQRVPRAGCARFHEQRKAGGVQLSRDMCGASLSSVAVSVLQAQREAFIAAAEDTSDPSGLLDFVELHVRQSSPSVPSAQPIADVLLTLACVWFAVRRTPTSST